MRILNLIAIGTALLLAGCGNTSPMPTVESNIIVLWHTFAGTERAALEALGDRFNATHPSGPTLILEYQEKISEKMNALPAEQQPDLIVTGPDAVSQFQDRATPIRLPDAIQRDLLPMAKSLYNGEDSLYALPFGLTTNVLYYNQEWVRDLGYTTEGAKATDLLNTACAATSMESGQVGLGIPAQADVLLSFLAAGGDPIVGSEAHYVLGNPDTVVAASIGHDLLSQGCGRIYEFLDDSVEQFGDSALALLIAPSLREPEIVESVLSGWNFTLGVAELPPVDETGGTLWRGPAILLFASDDPQRDAALEVALWMLSTEAQTAWFEQTHYLPVRRSLVEAWQTEERLRDSERQLMTLALTAAEQGTWSAWQPIGGVPACRAALVRALFDLNTDQEVPEVLSTAQTACKRAAEELP